MPLKIKQVTPEIVRGIYDLLGLSRSEGRLTMKVVITLQAGEAIVVEEISHINELPTIPET